VTRGAGSTDERPEVGVDVLELFVEVLSQSEMGPSAGEGFYDRLCEAVCRLARMRRAVIFRYDSTRRRAEYSTDASNYRVVPQVVVFPLDTDDVVAALGAARAAMPGSRRGSRKPSTKAEMTSVFGSSTRYSK
jgi:hypothetical protein